MIKNHLLIQIFIALCLVIIADCSFAQTYPKDYFRSPLDIPLKLAATFGEIRPNHFHAGLDIATDDKEGQKVYSVADGYVSRIKVSATGYGNALYITHPNGYTTVYGHLQRYNDAIQAYIKKNQYAKESFDIELFLTPDQFPLKKGDIVAYSGNTGGSTGPHLHFEIRDAKTESPINPLLFGFDIPDSSPPIIVSAKLYPLRHTGRIEGNTESKKYIVTKKSDVIYTMNDNVPIKVSGDFGISIEGYDKEDMMEDHYTIYYMELQMDGKIRFISQIDKFSFDETRDVNAHVDYEEMMKTYDYYKKCFREPNDKLHVYKTKDDGVINISDSLIHSIKIITKDSRGNASELNFRIKGDANSTNNTFTRPNACLATFPYQLPANYETKDIKIEMPAGILYDTLCFKYFESKGSWRCFSFLHHVQDIYTPLHSSYNLTIRCATLPLNLQSKALIALLDDKGNASSMGGTYKDGYVSTTSNHFGDFAVMVDTLAPVIDPINIYQSKNMAGNTIIKVKISDNLSGIKSYRGTINGKWILMVEDAKTQTLTYTFDEHTPAGKNTFELTVIDNKDNKSVYKADFFR